MTKDELNALHDRVKHALSLRERLEEAETFLTHIQGHAAIDQHEMVAQRLQSNTPRPRLCGVSVCRADGNWHRTQHDYVVTAEMQEHLCAAARLLVKQYREEWAAL